MCLAWLHGLASAMHGQCGPAHRSGLSCWPHVCMGAWCTLLQHGAAASPDDCAVWAPGVEQRYELIYLSVHARARVSSCALHVACRLRRGRQRVRSTDTNCALPATYPLYFQRQRAPCSVEGEFGGTVFGRYMQGCVSLKRGSLLIMSGRFHSSLSPTTVVEWCESCFELCILSNKLVVLV